MILGKEGNQLGFVGPMKGTSEKSESKLEVNGESRDNRAAKG